MESFGFIFKFGAETFALPGEVALESFFIFEGVAETFALPGDFALSFVFELLAETFDQVFPFEERSHIYMIFLRLLLYHALIVGLLPMTLQMMMCLITDSGLFHFPIPLQAEVSQSIFSEELFADDSKLSQFCYVLFSTIFSANLLLAF